MRIRAIVAKASLSPDCVAVHGGERCAMSASRRPCRCSFMAEGARLKRPVQKQVNELQSGFAVKSGIVRVLL